MAQSNFPKKTKPTDMREVIKTKRDYDVILSDKVLTPEFFKQTDNINFITWKDKTPKSTEKDVYIFTDAGIQKETVSKKVMQHLRKNGSSVPLSNGFGIVIQSQDLDLQTYGIHSTHLNNLSVEKNINIAELRTIEQSFVLLERHIEDVKKRNVYISSDNLGNMKAIYDYIRIKNEGLDPQKVFEERMKKALQRKKEKSSKIGTKFDGESSKRTAELYQDLVRKIGDFILENKINLSWNRGHNGYVQNELADDLANKAINMEQEHQFHGISRLPNVNLSFAITKVTPHGESVDLSNIEIKQKIHGGKNKISINDENVSFQHENHTLTKVHLPSEQHNRLLIIESDYQHSFNATQEKVAESTVKELKEYFFEQNKFIHSMVCAASLQEAITITHKHETKHNLEAKTTTIKLDAPTDLEYTQGVLNHLDNMTMDKRVKLLGDVHIQYPMKVKNKNVSVNSPLILNNKVYSLEDAFRKVKDPMDVQNKDVIGALNPAKTAQLLSVRRIQSDSIEEILEKSLEQMKKEQFSLVQGMFRKPKNGR